MSTHKRHYSGAASRRFWLRVNALPARENETLFACGVLLQNMETSVLHWLDDAERAVTAQRAAKTRRQR